MINEYSYGHLMILEISSDQQKRPAGLIKRETGVNPVQQPLLYLVGTGTAVWDGSH